jgi:hypothetical protein
MKGTHQLPADRPALTIEQLGDRNAACGGGSTARDWPPCRNTWYDRPVEPREKVHPDCKRFMSISGDGTTWMPDCRCFVLPSIAAIGDDKDRCGSIGRQARSVVRYAH